MCNFPADLCAGRFVVRARSAASYRAHSAARRIHARGGHSRLVLSGRVYVAQDLLLRKYDVTMAGNIRARRVHTQCRLVRRIAIAFVVIPDDPRLL